MIPKTDCFIRLNTPELREWMKGVDISMCPCCEFEDAEWLQVGRDGAHSIPNKEEALFLFENTKSIDCSNNVNLFKALAAMNDENDYMQWFTDGLGNFELSQWKSWTNFWHGDPYEGAYCDWRKATIEETIKYLS